MSMNIDKPLDAIISSNRTAGRGRGRGRGRVPRRATNSKAAPVGGVQKNLTKVTGRVGSKNATSAVGGESKILVSGLVRKNQPLTMK